MYVNGAYHDDYFVQEVEVSRAFKAKNRLEFIAPLCLGKKVLHVGFVDWPITDRNQSLHLQLSKITKKIDGYDVNRDGAEHLEVPNGNQYFDWSMPDDYDVVLCTEVLEHAGDVEGLIRNMDRFNASMVITVPCVYQCRQFFEDGETFREVVHPDHNCWFSPYTLKNVLSKYSTKRLRGLFWVGNISIGAILDP